MGRNALLVLFLLFALVVVVHLQKQKPLPLPVPSQAVQAPEQQSDVTPQAIQAVAVPALSGFQGQLVWAYDLCLYVGNKNPTSDTLVRLIAWQRAEGGNARFNPLNTTQDMPGATDHNTVGVKNYTSYEQGLEATAKTLAYNYPGYADILAGIATNDGERIFNGIAASPWGTNIDTIRGVYPQVQQEMDALLTPQTIQAEARPVNGPSGKKCPYTVNNNQFQDGFWAGGYDANGNALVGAWAGQYGARHLGVDFTGKRGDGVLAPWDATVISVDGYWTAGDPRYGGNLILDFGNGIFEYAGHLVDTYVTPGQRVAACTVIATLGATDFPHTHVTLRYSAAACEGNKPNEPGGCIDPIEYWDTH